jgi:hypothetical protein
MKFFGDTLAEKTDKMTVILPSVGEGFHACLYGSIRTFAEVIIEPLNY